MGFLHEGEKYFRCMTENDLGYDAVLAELPKYFPGIRTDWFTEVAFPPFAENRTTIWSKPISNTSAGSQSTP